MSPPRLPRAVTRAVVPRPVVCVIEHLHRDRSVADGVRAGSFRHGGVRLELGPEPDWHDRRLPADDEWRIEWSKFYEGLDLAHAYRQSGDRGYLDAWVRLVDSWIRQVPAGADPSDVIGRRVQNWVYAWQGFAAAPWFAGLPGGFAERLLSSLAFQLAHLEAHLTPERNHRTLELYGLLVTSLALPALDPGGRRARSALQGLHRNLLTDIWPDGVHRECSTHYHMIALRSFVGARQNAARYRLPVPDGYDDRLAAACRFAMHAHRPDGLIPALSDADTGSYLDVLDRAAAMLDRPELCYVATAGRSGSPPAERNVSFPHGGYYLQRSGWGDGQTPYGQERFLILDCGPLGDGGHGHYDLLNVEIFAAGRPLVVDPGRYSYSEQPPNWRRWFKGTAAHNTVTVDGLDQTPYRRGKPKGPVGRARLLGRHTAPGLDLLAARATSPAYDAVHDRVVAFVADQYWLVADTLRAAGSHHYAQCWHLPAAAWGRTRVERRQRDWVVHAPGLALVFPGPEEPAVEPGWVAEAYGVKRRAPVVVASRIAACAEFLTLVWPLEAGAGTVPLVRVGSGGPGRVAVTVEGLGAGVRVGAPRRAVPAAPGRPGLGWARAPGPARAWRLGPGWAGRGGRRGRPAAMTAATSLLAPDPRLPFRDVLLDPEAAGRRLAWRLRSGWALDVSGCELLRVKYRVGESLRAAYRVRVDGAEQVVAARMFTGGRSAAAYQRACARAVPSRGLRPVARDAELDTVLWSFPNDRRLDNLAALAVVPPQLRGILPRPWAASRLVAYAPEKSATARCLDRGGATIAYVKAYAQPEAGRFRRVLEEVAGNPLAAGRLRVPAVLGCSDQHRMLWLEAVGGRPLGELRGAELAQGLEALGAALAVLHRLPARDLPRFARLDLERLRGAAEVIGRARPELGAGAARLAAALAAARPAAGEAVHLHGDVHPRNVLVDGGRLALIDLDQAGAGQPAADLGSVLARLRQDRWLGVVDPGRAAALGAGFLAAYAAAAPLPAAAQLRWHTAAALLAERALRAVNRVIAGALPHLEAPLAEATELVARAGDDPMEVCR